MNHFLRYILIAFGEGILIATMCLLFPEGKTDLMVLDTISLSIVYLVNVLGYPSLVKQNGENEVAGYGIAWAGTWVYSAAVLAVVILFYWIDLSLSWQVIVQCALLFCFLSALYWAGVASRYAGNLDQKHKLEAQGIGKLKAKASVLQASLHEGMGDEIKREVTEIAERTGYLIPNRSTLAFTLEQQINTLLDTLVEAVATHQPDEKIRSLVGQCKSVLKQRMTLPNS